MYMCMKHYIPDIIVTPLTGTCDITYKMVRTHTWWCMCEECIHGRELAETSSQTLQICDLPGQWHSATLDACFSPWWLTCMQLAHSCPTISCSHIVHFKCYRFWHAMQRHCMRVVLTTWTMKPSSRVCKGVPSFTDHCNYCLLFGCMPGLCITITIQIGCYYFYIKSTTAYLAMENTMLRGLNKMCTSMIYWPPLGSLVLAAESSFSISHWQWSFLDLFYYCAWVRNHTASCSFVEPFHHALEVHHAIEYCYGHPYVWILGSYRCQLKADTIK